MPTYTTSEQSFAKIQKKITKRLFLTSSIVPIFFLIREIWKYFSTGDVNFTSVITAIVSVGIISKISTNKTIDAQREVWNSIEITIEEECVSRQQIRIPEVRINREEIVVIQESKHGLSILTEDKTRFLLIPIELDRADYLEIKEILSSWIEITYFSLVGKIKSFSTVALYSVIFIGLVISPFIWLSAIFGTLLIVWGIYSMYSINKLSGVDPQLKKANKRMFYLTLMLVFINVFIKWCMSIMSIQFEQEQRQYQHIEQSKE